MKLGVKFSEQNTEFAAGFGEVQTASDGGYERGYAVGYEKGNSDGYIRGHDEGVDAGVEQGYNAGMDAIVNQTVVSYRNDVLEKMSVAFFQGCITLETIILPKLTHIPSFLNCTALKNCDFSGARYVQSGVFKNCTSLEKMELPSAEQIHSNTFENCTSLHTLILRRTASIVSLGNTSSFAGTPIANGTGFIYVPDALVERYKTATNWSTYAAQIKPISELEVVDA